MRPDLEHDLEEHEVTTHDLASVVRDALTEADEVAGRTGARYAAGRADTLRWIAQLITEPVDRAHALMDRAGTPVEYVGESGGDAWNTARSVLVNAGVDLAGALLHVDDDVDVDVHCGACGQLHADGDCDLDPANVPAEADPWDGSGPLRVSTLRQLLDDLDPELCVVVDDGDGWYVNVGSVVRPVDDDDYSCVTLFQGAPWDARSL